MKSVPPARRTNQLLPLLIPTTTSPDEIDGAVQAALDHAIVFLELDDVPVPGVKYALELTSPRVDVSVMLLAELAGPPDGAHHPLELRPLGGRAALEEFLGASARRSSLLEPAADPFEGRLLGGGRYEVGPLIAAGSMGRVHRGRHLLLDRPIAIKVLHAEYAQDERFIAHFQGEARAASRLDHPNVCRVFDFGQDDDGLLFIVMELLEGTDLWQVGHQEGPFALETVVDYMSQICGALSVAHDRGVVHRDVKAENILVVEGLDDDGRPRRTFKVCDFGLAMTANAGAAEGDMQQVNGGTPEYMAPEAIRGEPVDARADVYACGVLLYFLSTGKLPFDDEDQRRILYMQLQNEVVPPSKLDPTIDRGLESVILRALSKDKAQRFANARDLRTALRALRAVRTPTGNHSGLYSSVVQASESRRLPPSSRRGIDSRPGARLGDETSGLAPVAAGLVRTILTGECTSELLTTLPTLLSGRSQLTFLRAESEKPDLAVRDGVDEVLLADAIRSGATALALADALARAGIAMLSLRDGLSAAELSALPLLARGTPGTPRAPNISIVFDSSRVGRHRPLAWRVDLAATELALSLGEVDPASRARSVALALRGVRTAEEARALLESSDIIGRAARKVAWDVASSVADGLAQPLCQSLVVALAEDLVVAANGGTARVPPELVRLFSRRLARDRTTASDELLRGLLARGLVAPADLPAELNQSANAELRANGIVQAPSRALEALDQASDDDTFAREVVTLEQATRILLSQGRLVALGALAEKLAMPGSDQRMIAASSRLLGIIHTPGVLQRVSLVLLRGPAASHAAAHSVIGTAGELGAAALTAARLQSSELDLGARKRFVSTMRRLRTATGKAVSDALAQIDSDSDDPILIEDLLHAVPDTVPEGSEMILTAFRSHRAPKVRRAALGALTETAGNRIEWCLLDALDDDDEGVRLSALIGLQKVGKLLPDSVARVEKVLGSGSDDLRAAAAGALTAISSAGRVKAIAVLTRLMRPKFGSRLGFSGNDEESPMVLEAVARALIEIGGTDGRRAVESRATSAKGEHRRRLIAALGG